MPWCQWCWRVDARKALLRFLKRHTRSTLRHKQQTYEWLGLGESFSQVCCQVTPTSMNWGLNYSTPGTGINTRGQSSALGSPSAGTSVFAGFDESGGRLIAIVEFRISVWFSRFLDFQLFPLCFSGSSRQRCGEQGLAPQSPLWRTEGDHGFVWKPQNPIESFGWSETFSALPRIGCQCPRFGQNPSYQLLLRNWYSIMSHDIP